MAFLLGKVVPWGRTLQEYKTMFSLTEQDLKKKIAGFGDGPASFNYEADKLGGHVISFDPIYQFSKKEISDRIEETREVVMEQTRANMEHYNWKEIKSPEELEKIRMSAMNQFLEDYEKGKEEGRYRYSELPNQIAEEDNSFDIGLSSHFLLLYKELGYEFHIAAMTEMLRLCREIRIFPICDLDSKQSELTEQVIAYFRKKYQVDVVETEYEFQKGGNQMLLIKKG